MYLDSEQLYLRDQFYWKCLSLYFDNSKSLLSTCIKLCSVCVCVSVLAKKCCDLTMTIHNEKLVQDSLPSWHFLWHNCANKKKVQTFSTFSELIIVIFEKKFNLPKFAQFEKKSFLGTPCIVYFWFLNIFLGIFVKIKRCQVISHFWELREA